MPRHRVNDRSVDCTPGHSIAATLWNEGKPQTRVSVSGEPRGPLCAMGTCFECRATVDGVSQVRTCLAQGERTAHDDAAALPSRVRIAVVGAGPAGIAAACVAAESGASALLIDDGMRPGGQIWRHREAAPPAARPWLDRLARSGARLLDSATVHDADVSGALWLEHATKSARIEFDALVIATGARERFLPFPGWTLPGAMGVGAAQALYKSGADFRDKRVVLGGSGPLLLPVAATLARAGAEIACVLEQAPQSRVLGFARDLLGHPARLIEAARYRFAFLSAPYHTDAWVVEALGTDRVEAVVVQDRRGQHRIACDLLGCAYGLVPNLELPRLLGCAIELGFVRVDERQATSVPHVFCAGEPTGIAGLESALASGEIAARAALGLAPSSAALRERERARPLMERMEATFALRPELRALARPDTIVCRCEDVRMGQLRPEWSARMAKLYTRVGMGPCQGRVCGSALEHIHGWNADAVRSPLRPVSIATMEVEA